MYGNSYNKFKWKKSYNIIVLKDIIAKFNVINKKYILAMKQKTPYHFWERGFFYFRYIVNKHRLLFDIGI